MPDHVDQHVTISEGYRRPSAGSMIRSGRVRPERDRRFGRAYTARHQRDAVPPPRSVAIQATDGRIRLQVDPASSHVRVGEQRQVGDAASAGRRKNRVPAS